MNRTRRALRTRPKRRPPDRDRVRVRVRDRGQATAEYALVLLGAATIALILIGWATGGGNRIAGLLDHVLDTVTGHVK